MASIVCEEFIDISALPENCFSLDGLFYSIPYFDDDALWHNGRSWLLLVTWKVENNSSFCPMRIEFECNDENNFSINIYDQTKEHTIKKKFFERENGLYYTEIKDYETITLSQLIQNNGHFQR